ncbi:hypothetical protein [Nocardia brasiliensis]|uniref:hypothetical protein n=1 Tax=Nocardia brasiliensis TaxID=37326 RepID=UPI0024568120|nr:hypothetical protein [Nocardia brasiliensis]
MREEAFDRLSDVAARQHGLVTVAQARRVDVDIDLVERFEKSRLISELDWSTYQLRESRYGPRYAYPLAAWLALAPERFRWERLGTPADLTVLSHESASAVWGLGAIVSPVVRFTSARARGVPRAMRIDVAPLYPDDVTIHAGVPVTTPHRTIVDLVRQWTARDDISRVFTDAMHMNMVNLRVLFEDLTSLSPRYDVPRSGRQFLCHYIPAVSKELLSPLNLSAYAELSRSQ